MELEKHKNYFFEVRLHPLDEHKWDYVIYNDECRFIFESLEWHTSKESAFNYAISKIEFLDNGGEF
jgi:hypothetical protein